MSQELLALREYFPTGTAEGDLAFLSEAFIVPSDYYAIIQPPTGSPRLLIGKKGSGKSAIVEAVRAHCAATEVPTVLLRPDDIQADVPSAKDMGTLKRYALGALVTAVATKLGESLRGLLSSSDAKLFSRAVKAGLRSPDSVQKALRALLPLGTAVSKIDFAKFLPADDNPSTVGMLHALRANLEREERLFYLLVDDTDQVAAPDEPDHLNRIWAFLLAARQLASQLTNVKCIITLRTEVWTRLQSDRSGQRDQVDHFRPLVVDYNPSDEHIQRILERRLVLAATRASVSLARGVYDPFFEGTSVRLPTSQEHRSWADFLVKNSRERPRDVIQFVSALAESAIQRNEDQISSATVDRCITKYSDERAHDLALEFERDCQQLLGILDTFATMPFRASAELVRKHLSALPSAFSITIHGVTLQPDNQQHLVVLWRLLHEAGFLNPRWSDAREDKNYRHGSFKDDPDLVSLSRWNDMLRADWEIHPAYRQHLLKKRADKAALIGVAPTALVKQ